MEMRDTLPTDMTELSFPDEAQLAALRGWYAGLDARAAVGRYLGDRREAGASSRGILGEIRQRLVAYAQTRHRADLAAAFVVRPTRTSGDSVARAIERFATCPCRRR